MISKTLQRSKSLNGLAYIKTGSGPNLVLIHGVGLRADAWMNQFEDLAKHFTVYAVDMPGHGKSNLFPACKDINSYTDVIASWVDSDIGTPVVIAGHSMGSMIALNFAIRYAHLCQGVIAFNSVFRRSDKAKKAVRERVEQMKNNISLEDISAPIKRWFDWPLEGEDITHANLCSNWLSAASLEGYLQAYEVFCSNDGPSEEGLAKLSSPALFLTGGRDPNSTPEMSERMASICPNGVAYIIDQARHMAPMTHYKEINPILIKFGQQCSVSKEEAF